MPQRRTVTPAARASLLRRVLSALAALCCALAPTAIAQRQLSQEELRAGFVGNFARYAEWPADAAASQRVLVCVLAREADSFPGALIDERTSGGRTLMLKRVVQVDDLKPCHIAYASEREAKRLLDWVQALPERRGLLTIAQSEGFANAGGAIELVFNGERFQFDVNLAALQAQDIRLPPNVLKLARRTVGGKR
jgi:hypothetical protein